MCILCELLGRSAAQAAAAHAAGGADGVIIGAGDAPVGSYAPIADGVSTNPTVGATIDNKPVWSQDQIVSNLERLHLKWQGVGPTITYQFYDTAPAGLPSDVTFAPLTADERALARQAFAQLADVANIHFVEATDNGVYGSASGRVSLYLNSAAPDYVWGSTQTFTRGFSGGFSSLSAAAIQISPDAVNARKLFVGGYNFQAMMHEIGHALGLPHPGDYNANGSTITYDNSAVYYQDSRQYTMMSYFDASTTGANFVPPGETASYSGATPLLDDIAVLQALYGANPTTRAGDTTYGFNSNAGNVAFDFTVTNAPVVSIYDSGGNDTIDLSGSSYGANLNLNSGVFSDVMGMVGNLSIAYGTTIENAKGSTGGDTLTGNVAANHLEGQAGDDTLIGGGGNDILDGGGGTDTAGYAATAASYDWWWNGDGTWTVDDGRTAPAEGTDKLISIEKLQFSDQTVALATPSTSDLIYAAFARVDPGASGSGDSRFVFAEASAGSQGGESLAAVYADLAHYASASTAVAVTAYQFFTGDTPSKVGLDYLLNPASGNANSLNSTYYFYFSTENRFINFAVNLGKLGDGAAAFAAAYGGLSLTDATSKAYAVIFGTTPTADKVAAILNAPSTLPGETTRADYFAYYGGDGPNGIGTKAAAVGWLLAEAVKADVGTYAKADDAYLAAVAAGTHQHIDLVGVYGQPGFAYTGG